METESFAEELPEHRGRLKSLWFKYERHASAIAFIAGFIIDNLTLRRVDLWLENLAFLSYILVAGSGIIIFHALDSRREQRGEPRTLGGFLPVIIQFSFGAIFSGFFVFYSRSASLAGSWPFILFLLFLLVGNELFRKHYARLNFQLSIFFIAIFSYSIFIVPVIFHSIGPFMFIVSGLLSLIILRVSVFFLARVARERYEKSRATLIVIIGLIYAAFNILYFTNLIPPIPLALKDIGVYHFAEEASAGGYLVRSESIPLYDFLDRWHNTFHRVAGEPVYVYSAVFAPTKLNTIVLHEWSYLDISKKEWVVTDQIRFPIIGGRDGGYRGRSSKANMRSGKWRVSVVTERGELLGRITFMVVDAASPPLLREEIR